ncbi:MAG: hypothetical protein ACTSRZ_06620, partial [Promethearchaeota archaeon]
MNYFKILLSKKRIILNGVLIIILCSVSLYGYIGIANIYVNQDNLKFENNNPPVDASAEYSNSRSGSGKNISIEVGMNYKSPTSTSMSATNSNSDILSVLAPTDQTFNTSFSNITVGNIQAPNKSITYEPMAYRSSYTTNGYYSASFKVTQNCYISNASFYVSATAGSVVLVSLFNSTWNGTDNVPTLNQRIINNSYTIQNAGAQWITLTFQQNSDSYLNNSLTANNTWYISLTTSSGTVNWFFEEDISDRDDSDSYFYNGSAWNTVYDTNSKEIDFSLHIGLSTSENLFPEPYSYRGGIDTAASGYHVASIYTPSNCYLVNMSFYINVITAPGSITIWLFNSTWNGTDNVPTTSYRTIYSDYSIASSGYQWVDINFDLNETTYLNNSDTTNNTWYVLVWRNGANQLQWMYEADFTNRDNETVYKWVSSWVPFNDPNGDTVDFSLKASFAATNTTTVKPSDIGLKISGTPVSDVSNPQYNGQWTSNEVLNSSGTGQINYEFTIDYWEASWEANATINYTKSDLSSTSSYSVNIRDQVQWEINKSINLFNSTFQDFVIKYLVPDEWTIANAYNWTTQYNVAENDISGPNKEAIIYNAGNSETAEWSLKCTSENYANTLYIYLNGGNTNSSTANYSDTIDFRANFDGVISGDVNFTVYSPSGFINYTSINSSLTNEVDVWFPTYDISVNLTEYGVYKAQYFWSNETYVAFWQSEFTVYAETNLSITSGNQNENYTNEDIFEITIFYNDTGLDAGIQGATISYKINNGATRTDNIQDIGGGYYNITIYSWEINDFGLINISINASKQYYNLAQTIFQFNRYNQTTKSLDQSSFNVIRNTNVTIHAHYMDNESNGIPNANVIWSASNDPNWEYFIQDVGNGEYTIELNNSQLGQTINPFIVEFTIQSDYNISQQYSVSIKVYNRTSIIINSLSQTTYGVIDNAFDYEMYYGANVTVNFSMIDIDYGNQVITGGQANLTFNGYTYYDLIDDNGIFLIEINTVILNAADDYQITEIAVNRTDYQNSSTTTSFDINPAPSTHDDPILRQAEYGNNPIDNSTKPPSYQVYYGCDVDVEILYKNGYTNNPITNAEGMLIFNSNYYFDSNPADGIYRFNVTFNTVGVGTYQ